MHTSYTCGRRVLIAGAAGRDFHNFNVVYRGRDEYDVVALHGDADPGHRRARLSRRCSPASSIRTASRSARRPSSSELIREHEVDEVVFAYSDVTHEHVMHVALARARGRRELPAPVAARHDAHVLEAGRRDLRRADGLGQEPDDAPGRAAAPRRRQARGRAPAPDAVRRPDETGRPALRALRGPGGRRLHDRGARGVRAAPRRGQPRLRGHRLRGDPRGRRARGGRDRLGRRQQRHAVHPARRSHRRRRPAPARARAALPPGRDEPAHGERLRREQGGQRDAGRHRRGARLDPDAQSRTRRSSSPTRRSTSRAMPRRSRASACSRSRTARR